MDKNDAEVFTKLCGFVWQFGNGDIYPLIFDYQEKNYNDNNINFNTLSHLDSIGLVVWGRGSTIVIKLSEKSIIKF